MPDQPPVVLSMGDPAGIGPEIIATAWRQSCETTAAFCVVGSPSVFRALDSLPVTLIRKPEDARRVFTGSLPVLDTGVAPADDCAPGHPSPANAKATLAAIDQGVALCLEGKASALVTAPVSKSVLYDAGFGFPGHTEFLANLTKHVPTDGPRGPVMMLAAPDLRVVLTSIHEPLLKAVFNLDPARIEHVARLTHHALRRDFGIERPRLALAGLNPHAGEGGALGREEQEVLLPLASRLRAEGLDISDPMAPDTMFHAEARAGYDAAICHYHDQGLIPVKTLDFHGGVNITLGLPIVRTSPDHGTAFDIAGTGQARADSLLAAIRAAQTIAGHRHG